MNKYILHIGVASALLLSGCSGKYSLLVPGQTESDCDAKAENLGVCATPKNAYQYKDKIGKIWHVDGEGYYINKSGRVFNVETQEEVIPGEKPDDCLDAVCINCDDNGEVTTESGVPIYASESKGGLQLSNRSLVVSTPSESAVIRDLGWQQRIWIAPMQSAGDDFIEAHAIHVVIKKPSWVVGEKVPKNVKRGIVIPSVLAKEVLTDSHVAISRKSNKAIDNYVRQEHNTELKSIREFIQQNKEAKND